ncbi:unnamed protein product [Arabidopsis lyrata]|uniref:Predicted protein n=1 Tax=Arabidopsis lyrata subsp. lyrata TaxID=81972 RepID=D7MT50_ARALL|nr:predicted protein [Arabidopsis lyrata subsp. lyrata]CAH8280294.1 unnamed protein product [Arabidopsis lyrata]
MAEKDGARGGDGGDDDTLLSFPADRWLNFCNENNFSMCGFSHLEQMELWASETEEVYIDINKYGGDDEYDGGGDYGDENDIVEYHVDRNINGHNKL